MKGLSSPPTIMQGGVTLAQLDNIRLSARSLVEDFESREDAEPRIDDKAVNPSDTLSVAEWTHTRTEAIPGHAPSREALPEAWRSATPVLCIAGRGPLDDASSAMLAQLLREHGLGASLASYKAISREGINDLDVKGVAMICVAYLDITGNPAHLRYLLERLKRKVPGVPILVGLWPEGEMVLTDMALGREVGADMYVVSLRAAVEACLKTAAALPGSGQAAA